MKEHGFPRTGTVLFYRISYTTEAGTVMGKEGKAWRGGYAGCRLDLYREQGHGENAHRRGSGAAMGTDGERP